MVFTDRDTLSDVNIATGVVVYLQGCYNQNVILENISSNPKLVTVIQNKTHGFKVKFKDEEINS